MSVERYQIIEKLGEGEMGTAFKARDLSLLAQVTGPPRWMIGW